jgi:outer membrane protein TolC
MQAKLLAGPLAAALAGGCQTYSPAPVDLEAHARSFAARIPDAGSIGDFAARLRMDDGPPRAVDADDGLDRHEGQYVALLFNAELRAVRLRAGVARAAADASGRWPDPELNAGFAKILESVAHPWIATASIALTLPVTGRPGLERELAESRHAQALLEARAAEARVLDALDLAWTRWSARRLEVDALADLIERLTALEAMAARLAAAQELNHVEARAFSLDRVSRQAQWIRARAAAAAAEAEIRQLLGLPPERDLRLVPATAIALRVGDEGARRALIDASPSVVLAEHEHELAERQLALAVARQWPELRLLPGFEEEDAQPRAALSFALPLPLWNGNGREIAESRAARGAAAETLRGSLERAMQDLARAEARRAAALEQRDLVEGQLVPLAEQQVVDGRKLADLGQLDVLLVLDALGRSFDAKALAIEAALAVAEATVEINALFWPSLALAEEAGS